MGVGADHQVVGIDRNASLLKTVDLLKERDGVEDDAVADDASFARPENPGWDEVKNVFLTFVENGVARVVAALGSNDDVRRFGQVIDDLGLFLRRPTGLPR